MKIKIPLFSLETDEECPCSNYNDYKIKLKCMRMKLHSRYIACISTGIVIWMLATGQANTKEFSNWISFASTIASIILSVIAIILSITGESKTDAMREQMEETAKKLENTADAIGEANRENRKNIYDLQINIEELQYRIENMPTKMTEAFQQYEKLKDETKNNIVSNVNNDVKWVKKND